MKKIALILTLVSFGALATEVKKGATVVKVVEQTNKGFQVEFLTFPDQHTAEEFADQVNSAPTVKYKASWKVWRHATVYAK